MHITCFKYIKEITEGRHDDVSFTSQGQIKINAHLITQDITMKLWSHVFQTQEADGIFNSRTEKLWLHLKRNK